MVRESSLCFAVRIDLPFRRSWRPSPRTSTSGEMRFESTGEEVSCRPDRKRRSSSWRRPAPRTSESVLECVTVVLLINCYSFRLFHVRVEALVEIFSQWSRAVQQVLRQCAGLLISMGGNKRAERLQFVFRHRQSALFLPGPDKEDVPPSRKNGVVVQSRRCCLIRLDAECRILLRTLQSHESMSCMTYQHRSPGKSMVKCSLRASSYTHLETGEAASDTLQRW